MQPIDHNRGSFGVIDVTLYLLLAADLVSIAYIAALFK